MKYYIINKATNEVLEAVTCRNEIEARKQATQKHLDLVLAGQLVVVGKAGFEKHYK
jgi:hypothetical protein